MAIRTLFQVALAGGKPVRPLVAPVVGALAGHLEGLSPQTFLMNPTKMANLLRDIQGGTGADVVWAEAGSGLELEAAGAPDPMHIPRVAVVGDVIARLRSMLTERALVGVRLAGPCDMAQRSGGFLTTRAAAASLLALVRVLCGAGAQIVVLAESGVGQAATDEDGLAALRPIWSTVRYFQSLPVYATGPGTGPAGALRPCAGVAVPCVLPEAGVELAASWPGNFGLAIPAETTTDALVRVAVETGRCLLLTSPGELSRWYGIADLPAVTARLNRLAGQ